MLFKTTVSSYTGSIFKNTGEHVLNTDRILRYNDRDGSSTSILYAGNKHDRRSAPMPALITATVSEIKSSMDQALGSNVMTLSVFPGDDVTATPVDKYIDYADFMHASPLPSNSSYSIVTISNNFSTTKAVVNSTLDAIVSSASGATTTTTEFPGPNILDAYVSSDFRLRLYISFDKAIDSDVLATQHWVFKADGAGDLNQNTGVTNPTPTLTYISLNRPVLVGEVITLDYNPEATVWGKWKALANGIEVAETTDYPVTNNPPNPSDYTPWDCYYTTGGSPNTINLYFTDDGDVRPTGSSDQLYASSTPDASDFTFSGFGTQPNITNVEVFSGYVRLTFDSDPSATSPTISYTAGVNPLFDFDGLIIQSFSDFSMRIDN